LKGSPTSCWICLGEGMILYKKNGTEHACACICPKGSLLKALPQVDKVLDIKRLAKENYCRYKNRANLYGTRKEATI